MPEPTELPRITCRRMDKDDKNSWAVLRGGEPIEDLQELSREDAYFYKKRILEGRARLGH